MALINRNKNQGIVAVEITANALKVLNLAKQGTKFKISGLGISGLEDNTVSNGRILNKDAFTSSFATLASEHKINGKKAVYALTSAQVTTKSDFFAPEIPDKELEKQISGNLSRYSPVPLKEAAFDFRKTGKKKSDKDEIAVYVAKSEFINDRSQYLEKVGLIPKVVTTIASSIEEFVRVFDIGQSNGEAFAIFNFDTVQSTLFILKGTKVIAQRNFEIGSSRLLSDVRSYFPNEDINTLDDIQNNETVREKYEEQMLPSFLMSVCNEISREIQLYQTGVTASEVTDIFFGGEINNFPGLIRTAKSEFTANVQELHYLDKQILVFTNSKEKEIFAQNEQELFLLVAIGLAGLNPNLPNVLPWRVALLEANKKDYQLKAVIAGVLGCALVYGFMQYGNALTERQVAANDLIAEKTAVIDAELEKQKDIQEKNRLMQQKIDLIKNLQTNRSEAVRIANAISASTPMSTVLTKVQREGQVLTITGRALSTDEVILFMRNLKDTAIFENIFMSSFVTPDIDPSKSALSQEANRGSIPEDNYSTFSLTMKINIHVDTGIEIAEPNQAPIAQTAQPAAPQPTVIQPGAVAMQPAQMQPSQGQAQTARTVAPQPNQPVQAQAAAPQPSQSNTDIKPRRQPVDGQFNGVQ